MLLPKRLCALLGMTITTSVLAGNLFVSESGDNSYSGSKEKPWKTVSHAIMKAVPGDHVYVAEGKYYEDLKTVRNGMAGSPISFYGNGNVVLSSISIRHKYINFEGFTITGVGKHDFQGAVTLEKNSASISLKKLTFRSTPKKVFCIYGNSDSITDIKVVECLFVNTGFHAASLRGSGHLFQENFFESTNGWDALRILCSNTTITGNIFTNWSNTVSNKNHTDIFQTFSANGETATNVVIEKNLVINCQNAQIGNLEDQSRSNGVSDWIFVNNIFSEIDQQLNIFINNAQIIHNTFFKCTKNTGHPINIGFSEKKGNGSNSLIMNNMFVECGRIPIHKRHGWYHVALGNTNVLADWNFVCGPDGARKDTRHLNEMNGINGGMIEFSDPKSGRFYPTKYSSIISAASTLPTPVVTDFYGVRRKIPSDLGAVQALEIE